MKNKIKTGVLLTTVAALFFGSVSTVNAIAAQADKSGTTNLSCISQGNQEVQIDWVKKGDLLHTVISGYRLNDKNTHKGGRITVYVHDKVNASSGAENLIVDGKWHSSNVTALQVIPASAKSVWMGAQLAHGGFPGYKGCRIERNVSLE